MAENNYTADRRLYLDRDGNMVEADNPARATLLVAKEGKLSAEDAAKYGLTGQPAPEEKAQSAPPANKAQPAPDATKAAQELAEAEGVNLSEVEGTGQGGRITLADVEGAVKE